MQEINSVCLLVAGLEDKEGVVEFSKSRDLHTRT